MKLKEGGREGGGEVGLGCAEQSGDVDVVLTGSLRGDARGKEGGREGGTA